MPVGRIVIHAGLPKTGSTSIQSTLYSARTNLRKRSIYYSDKSPNHVFLVALFHQEPHKLKLKAAPDPAALLEIDTLFRQEAFDLAIFSSELLQGLDQPGLHRLAEFFDQYTPNLRVVMYVRHPVSYCQSWAQERVKQGAQDLKSIIARPPHYRFAERLPRWVEAFGRDRIVIRPFDRSALKDGDLIADFCDVCGLPDIAEWGVPKRLRARLSLPALLLADEMRPNPGGPVPQRALEVLSEIGGQTFMLPPAAIKRVRVESQADLEYLRSEFGIELPDPGDEGIIYRHGNIFTRPAIRSIAKVINDLVQENEQMRRKLKGSIQ